ncbi:hypothetical protein N9N32_00230 [Alphaproteobacteria bacterium]|nr:hypothetical protein [Alphaproteobacteria bacterium]
MNRKRIERINRIEEEITALSADLKKEQRRGKLEDKAIVATPLAIATSVLLAVVVSVLSSAVMIGL